MEYDSLIPVFTGPLNEFPPAEELPGGAKTVTLRDTFGYPVRFIPGVEYARRSMEVQHLHLLLPEDWDRPDRLFPLVVYIQGSAWHRQQIFEHLPHMIRVCQQGFAVAMVEYRPSEVAPFPAQVQDAKAAVRFLRMHAEQYHIDRERIGIWGDSSGGHTAVMAGVTGDRDLDPELYGDYSAEVRCIVDWYGPMDISKMNLVPSTQDHTGPDSPEGYLIGRKHVLEHPELAAATVPMRYLSAGVPTPPVLILHGSKDHLVHFSQSCLLYSRLKELGKDVELYKLEGAYHGFGGFHSEEAIHITVDFLNKHLRGE